MRDYKNIDRIFQEKLKDYEVLPPNKSWEAIEKNLTSSPVKKSFIPFWMKIASVAAMLLLLFSVGTIYILPSSELTISLLPDKLKENVIKSAKDSAKINSTTVQAVKNTLKNNTKVENRNNLALKNVEQPQKDISKKNSSTKHTEETKTLNSFLFSNEFSTQKNKIASAKNTKTENSSKFTVATIFAPIFFNSFDEGSGVDSQFKNNSVSGNSSYSYGVKLAYQVSNKITVQSGVNLINLGYSTNNIFVSPDVQTVGYSDLSASPLFSKETLSKTTETDLATIDANSASLNQVFGYVEIPVELKYNVANGKLGVNLVGGFSTLLLNKDEVFIETNSFSQSLGASNNLRSVNFSGNIGVDVDYSIYKNLFINVSPMFKVQTNTFSKNSGSFQPYYLGVYTGLNYKF